MGKSTKTIAPEDQPRYAKLYPRRPSFKTSKGACGKPDPSNLGYACSRKAKHTKKCAAYGMDTQTGKIHGPIAVWGED